jgi:hypothetical protein
MVRDNGPEAREGSQQVHFARQHEIQDRAVRAFIS